MTRKELAIKVFDIIKNDDTIMIKDIDIWKSIATTDDISLLSFYEEKALKGGCSDGKNGQT